MSLIYPSEALPEINWNNPLINGCVFALDKTNSSNFIGNTQGDLVNATVTDESIEFAGSGYLDFSGDWGFWGSVISYPFTMIAVARANSVHNGTICSFTYSGNPSDMFGLQFRNTGKFGVFARNFDGSIDVTSGIEAEYQTGKEYAIVAHFSSPTERSLTISGVKEDPLTGISVALPNSFDRLTCGAFLDSTAGDYLDGSVSSAFVLLGNKTDSELISLSQNPFQLFETAATKRDNYALAFGTSQSLEVDSLTGQVTIEFELAEDMPAYDASNPKILCRSKDGSISGNVSLSGNNEWATVRGDIIEIYVNDVALNVTTTWSTWTDYFIGNSTVASPLTNAKANDVVKIRQNAIDSLIFGNRTDMLRGFSGLKIKWLKVTDDNGVKFWHFDKQGAHATIADEYNGAIATLNGSPTFEPIIEKQAFTTSDYPSFSLLNSAENNRDYQVDYNLLNDIAGGSLSGFSSGITITSTANAITSALTLTTTGYTRIYDLTVDDVDATGATEAYIDNCEAQNVTG